MGRNDNTTITDFIVLVHGTWARGAAWTRRGSLMCDEIQRTFGQGVRIARLAWSGRNRHDDRIHAAARLRGLVKRLRRTYPAAQIHLVGHSHGGNVVAHACQHSDFSHQIANIVFLSVPFVVIRVHVAPTDYVSGSAVWRKLLGVKATNWWDESTAARALQDQYRIDWHSLPRYVIIASCADEAVGAMTTSQFIVSLFDKIARRRISVNRYLKLLQRKAILTVTVLSALATLLVAACQIVGFALGTDLFGSELPRWVLVAAVIPAGWLSCVLLSVVIAFLAACAELLVVMLWTAVAPIVNLAALWSFGIRRVSQCVGVRVSCEQIPVGWHRLTMKIDHDPAMDEVTPDRLYHSETHSSPKAVMWALAWMTLNKHPESERANILKYALVRADKLAVERVVRSIMSD